ncbi:2-dehydropantoate 2-reductase [Microbacterium sp. BK668]|uniref:ketopantoate reductase family protein n=1 Tax=Microbacterium sp. BK668 TaxID=2512118 RepID=UPI00105ED4C9|nr:2-dehydropantoate 2-reductase [Microbacterium sp. BK668]TDN92161.1 ketopantoate reductase [Microbacterium sp. BK668]
MSTGTARIAVVGAGANGASIGADLIESGHDVTLIEQWPAHVEAMRSDGLTVRTTAGEATVRPRALHVCQVAELRHPFDAVLLVMKAYDTRWAAELVAPHVTRDGLVAAVQNGMTTPAVAAALGPERAVGTVIEVSATMTQPGVVQRHTPPDRSWFAVDADPRAAPVAELLRSSGRVETFDDIGSAKWMKLVSNASVLVPTAVLGAPMLDAIEVTGMRDLMLEAGREALAVGRARGHGILPIFGLTAQQIADEPAVVETMLDVLYDRFVVPGATTTVLQDWTKGRRSEVDDINGLVVAEGRRLGVATPANERIVDVAHRIERGELDPSTGNAALLTG